MSKTDLSIAPNLVDWDEWHRQYQIIPALQARLTGVREQLIAAANRCPAGPIRIVSVCAGDGRDIIGALENHARRADVTAWLLDNHLDSIQRGEAMAAQAGLRPQLRFLHADASLATSYSGIVPTDIVLLSGFLGHLRHESLPRLIESLPMLCRTGGWIIWNRHLVIHDGHQQVPSIRELFRRSRFSEDHYETTAADGFAIGRHRFDGPQRPLKSEGVFFEFFESPRSQAVADSNFADNTHLSARPLPAVVIDSNEVESSIPRRFSQMVSLHADRHAVGSGEWRPTYGELNAAANRLAQRLLPHGKRGDRVALLLRHDAPLIASMLAVLKVARAVVVLNATDPPSRLKQILDDAEPVVILTDAGHAKLARQIAASSQAVIVFEECSTGPDHDPEVTIVPSDMAFLIYTSGSTGRPKGVIQTHRNILHNVRRHTHGMQLSAGDRMVLLGSPSGGQGMAMSWSALLNGAMLCPFPTAERGVTGLAEWLLEHEITVYVSSVSVFRNFARALSDAQLFPAIRLARFASEAASHEDLIACWKHFGPDCVALNTFSSSETGNITQYRLTADLGRFGRSRLQSNQQTELSEDRQFGNGRRDAITATDRIPIGHPAPGIEVLLWDEQGHEIVNGGVGEIVVRSSYLSPGYWRNEKLTAERFFGGDKQPGIFRTGDLAFRNPDGALVFAGRKDDVVKINGNRVELLEIQTALTARPEVQEALVRAYDDGNGDKRLIAYVVPRPGRACVTDTLVAALRSQLPGYMVPGRFILLEEFPLTPHGKVDYQALPDPGRHREAISRGERPRDIVEKSLAWIWESVLGVSPIGRYDDFFELGGTSLQSVEVLLHVEEKFGAALPSSILAEFSTIEKLAPLLAEHVVVPSPSPLVVLRHCAAGRPLFLMHSGQGDVTTYGVLARRLKPRPIYGLQSVGLQAESWPLTSVPAMAGRYLREILARDPTGPYLLAGTCMGGIVAFEIAQQLVRQGRCVGLLALFDVPHPVPSWREDDRIERLYAPIRDPLRDAARMLRWAFIRSIGLGRSAAWLSAYRRFVANMNSFAARRYSPSFYAGVLTLFNTLEQKYPGQDRRLMMRSHAQAARMIHLPGNRRGLFAKPVVDELGARLQECLEQAERQ